VVSGDTVDGDVTDNFYIDQDAAVAAVGGHPARIHSAASAAADAAKAFHTALVERATVVLSMPVNIQEEYVDFEQADIPPVPVMLAPGASPQALQVLVEALSNAERPVIIGGRGAWGAA